MSKAIATKDWSDMVIEAHAKGYVTKTNLKTLSTLLPEMKTTFNGALDAVYEMTEDLIKAVENIQTILPTDGSMAEGAGSQALIEMVKTGSAMIRKVTGIVEGAI